MTTLTIINFLIAGFLGYVVGRLGDNYLNHWMKNPSSPHHWIYGMILMLIGFYFFKNNLEIWIVSFGFGLFVSDLKDFWDLKFWGKDSGDKSKRKFWHID